MKKFFILIMILMMTIRFVLAQQGENLVRNGTFEQGNVGFKSDCRYFSYDVFWGKGCEGFQPDSIYFSKDPFGVENIDPYGKKDSLYFSKDAYGESFFVTNNRFYFYEKCWKCLVVDSLELAFRLKQFTNPTLSGPVKDTTGNFLLAWNAYVRGYEKLWYDSITVKPNTTYSFSCIESYPVFWGIFVWNGKAIAAGVPGIIKLCVNGKKVSNLRIRRAYTMNGWRTISGTFTSGSDQSRIEISIKNEQRRSLAAVDNIVFKEIQAGEYEKEFAKEERFPKLGDEAGVVLPRGVKQDEDWFLRPPRVKKEESVVEIPLVKEGEPIAITPPVKKEEAVIEILPLKEEEPVVETPPVKEEEPIVIISPVKEEESIVEIPPVKEEEPVVVTLPKSKPPVVVTSKQKLPVIPPRPKLPVIVSPKPPVVILSKPRLPVVVLPKPVKKDVATLIVGVSADFKKDISIDEIKVDQKLQLSHIYFKRAKFNLLATSLPELNDLTAFMKKHPTVRIRLEGHTDNQGDPQLNLELSENRVKEVKKYLTEQGIDDNRIEWVGYGGERSTNSNSTEYLRQKNRRVEVVIIGK